MDGQIWFYIAAAVIYFLTRKKKKPEQPRSSQPDRQSSNQPEVKKPVSFEDLLKEITEQRGTTTRSEESIPEESVSVRDEPRFKQEGQIREFADEESRDIYEESIRRAKEIDIPYEPDEHYKSKRLFKGNEEEVEASTIADEIREGLSSADSAKKAIIYSEILNRKY